MKLEDQVCSFELADKLYQLGLEKESIFVWTYSFGMNILHVVFATDVKTNEIQKNFISAYTSAELGEFLPEYIENNYKSANFYEMSNFFIKYDVEKKDKILWSVALTKFDGFEDEIIILFDDQIEANARAKMLIYLIKTYGLEIVNYD